MVNTKQLKESVDCRHLIERDLGAPKYAGGSYSQWACPMHGEKHGHSLTAWATSWRCFGACQSWGDAIKWLEVYHSLSFEEACHALGAPEKVLGPVRMPQALVRKDSRFEPPSFEWQLAAMEIVEQAEIWLWGNEGKAAREYLMGHGPKQRGLHEMVIQEARLGFIPGAPGGWHDNKLGLAVPNGITIPTIADTHLWGVKVRRSDRRPPDMDKYGQFGTYKKHQERLGRGNLAGGLHWADNLAPGWPALIVEGEFDCLIAWQEARDLVCPITVGSATNNLNPYWYAALAGCNPILVCTDADNAGDNAARRLVDFGPRVKRVKLPHGKDLTEFYLSSEMLAVHRWLETVLSSFSKRASAA